MFQSISWQSYWITMGFLMAGYYFLVYLTCFRRDFSIRFPGKKTFPSGEQTHFPGDLPSEDQQQPPSTAAPVPSESFSGLRLPGPDMDEQLASCCLDELNAFFEQARGRKWSPPSLVATLGALLNKYPSLRSSPYKDTLTGVITTHCEHHCSLHLSAEEVERVWQNG